MHATYSPEDNKLRLYAESRLDSETYAKVKAAGFRWAPVQQLFVAPMWTPQREDLLIELCGDIGDEDTTLAERAEERADRFDKYSDNRLRDANRAKEHVDAIADGIPFGQPILVGHHSERRARKAAETIENGMRKAVKMWETSKYWTQRAAGAVAAAKYKELPAVRHRRIKGLEADIRRCQSEYTPTDNPPHTIFQHDKDGNPYECVWCGPKGRGGRWVRVSQLAALEAGYARWVQHYENRLAYEKAMLGESGGIAAAQFDLKVGGQVLVREEWVTITRLNKKNGEILSVSTNARYVSVIPVERIRDYRQPTAENVAKVAKVNKLPPLCNYPGPALLPRPYRHDSSEPPIATEFVGVTQEQWDKCHKDHKGTTVAPATDTTEAHRVRQMMIRTGEGFMGYGLHAVYITDAKIKHPGKPAAAPVALPCPEVDLPTVERLQAKREAFRAQVAEGESNEFAAMKQSLRQGVTVVSAPQLFPTPPEIAEQVIELADIRPEMEVLEPSAGTGVLAQAAAAVGGIVTCVEIKHSLCERLRDRFPSVYCSDFLEKSARPEFDRIVMNPPFASTADIKHIEHARQFLKPGGRLVAICAAGPRQRKHFVEDADTAANEWIDLPEGAFQIAGTGVRTAIVVIDA